MRLNITTLGEIRNLYHHLEGFEVGYDFPVINQSSWSLEARNENSGISLGGRFFTFKSHDLNIKYKDLKRVAIEKGIQNLIPIAGFEYRNLSTGEEVVVVSDLSGKQADQLVDKFHKQLEACVGKIEL